MAVNPDEQALLQRCRQGDEQAFRELVERYHRLIYTVAYQVLRDRHEAEDLTQEVFVQVYLKLKEFRGESSLSSWLYRIAYHQGLNYRRDLKLERRELMEDASTLLASATESPMESIENKEEVEKLLSKLPAHDRLILTLFYLEEHSIQEIAEILEISVNSVKVRLHRARERIHV